MSIYIRMTTPFIYFHGLHEIDTDTDTETKVTNDLVTDTLSFLFGPHVT